MLLLLGIIRRLCYCSDYRRRDRFRRSKVTVSGMASHGTPRGGSVGPFKRGVAGCLVHCSLSSVPFRMVNRFGWTGRQVSGSGMRLPQESFFRTRRVGSSYEPHTNPQQCRVVGNCSCRLVSLNEHPPYFDLYQKRKNC